MQKMINAPQAAVDEMIEGYLKAHPKLVAGTDNPRVLKFRRAPVPGKVGIVTGGGLGP
jgi:dihydroxyacetone kinase-like protein